MVRKEKPAVLGNLLGSRSVAVLEQLLAFTEARHEVLAANIANIDTPGYRMRDLAVERFQESLREAIEAQGAGGRRSAAGLLGGSAGGSHAARLNTREAFEAVRDARETIVFHDDNNRSIEVQVAEMTKNTMLHNLAAELLRSQVALLQAAISERV